jgi:hypothetical protein
MGMNSPSVPTPESEYDQQLEQSKEKAGDLLRDMDQAKLVISILGGNGLTIEQDIGGTGAPRIKLNKIDMSEPTLDEQQAVESLANFLGSAGGVMTRFPNKEYEGKTGHNLRLLWGSSLNTNSANLLDEVEGLLKIATSI